MSDSKIRSLLAVVADATASSHIVVAGTTMAPLLPKTVDELFAFWQQGLSAIAVCNGQIVGHAAVEPLTEDWFELGAVWVHPDVRGRTLERNGSHPHVGLRLYKAILKHHREKNILATTINAAAMVVGWRVGMVPIGFDQLPRNVWEATCCCPSQKTGVPREENVPRCGMRQQVCFARITQETWWRLDRPKPCALPVSPPTTAATIPNDDIVILLAE